MKLLERASSALLAPYAGWILAAILAALVAALGFAYHQGKQTGQLEGKATMQATVDDLKAKVAEDAAALTAAESALKEADEAARFQAAQALAQRQRAEVASAEARRYEDSLRRSQRLFAQQLEDARRAPACKALLDTRVSAVCPQLAPGGVP